MARLLGLGRKKHSDAVYRHTLTAGCLSLRLTFRVLIEPGMKALTQITTLAATREPVDLYTWCPLPVHPADPVSPTRSASHILLSHAQHSDENFLQNAYENFEPRLQGTIPRQCILYEIGIILVIMT